MPIARVMQDACVGLAMFLVIGCGSSGPRNARHLDCEFDSSVTDNGGPTIVCTRVADCSASDDRTVRDHKECTRSVRYQPATDINEQLPIVGCDTAAPRWPRVECESDVLIAGAGRATIVCVMPCTPIYRADCSVSNDRDVRAHEECTRKARYAEVAGPDGEYPVKPK